MSFSTKIVDCLSSGAAPMAVCDALQGGYVYLKKNDCAICVDSLSGIEDTLRKIVNRPEIVIEYADKAKKCVEANHSKEKTDEMLLLDFTKLVEEGK